MRVGTLDMHAGATVDAQFRFGEPGSLLDLDLVIWDCAGLIAHSTNTAGAGRRTLSVEGSESLLSQARHWRSEFEAHHARGGCLVVFTSAAACAGVHTLQEVVDFDPLELLPGGGVRQIPLAAPAAIRSTAGEPFARFFERNTDRFIATSRLATDRGTTICNLSQECSSDKASTGVYQHAYPGRWLVLPSLRLPDTGESSAAAPGPDLVTSIVELVARLRGDTPPAGLASWALAPLWPAESEAATAYDRARQQRIALKVRSEELRRQLDAFAGIKRIVAVAAPGNAQAAATALTTIGLPTHLGDAAGNFLLTPLPDGTVAVGTVVAEHTDTGASSTFAETAQRNAIEVMGDTGTPARAWLLYSGDHRIEPSRRPGVPGQLLEKAASIGVGVVTSIELLDAWHEPAARPRLHASIRACPVARSRPER